MGQFLCLLSRQARDRCILRKLRLYHRRAFRNGRSKAGSFRERLNLARRGRTKEELKNYNKSTSSDRKLKQ